ncbi:MAG: hypothetical protein WDZ94_00715 [Patescibacteria group bacterium]
MLSDFYIHVAQGLLVGMAVKLASQDEYQQSYDLLIVVWLFLSALLSIKNALELRKYVK